MVRVTGKDWAKQTLRWRLPASVPAKGQPVRFVIRHASGGGAIDVDQIELFPDDAVNGVDPDVIRRAREWRIPILRYPGGNFVSGYRWRDGVGPRERRPTRRNPAWGGVEPNHFGTDEFLDFARRIGATPQIAVNAGDGTPEEAAAWVRHCNAKALRVPVWEIGNELYGGWQIGHTDPAGNAARFVRFRDAMLRADPRIRIVATGKGDEFLPDGLARNREWNTAVLRAAATAGGRLPDYLSLHPLVPLPADLRGLSYAEQYESAMAHPTFLDNTLLPDVVRQIGDVQGSGARTRVAVTEWGIIVGGDRWWESPNHDVQAGAVFNALTLNALLRHGDRVTLANMTAFMHGGGIKKPDGIVIVDPQYHTQRLYSVAEPRFPWKRPGPGRGGTCPGAASCPRARRTDVDVFAALSPDRARLLAFVVNRSRTDTRPVRLNIAGFAVNKVSATVLTAPDPQARNNWQAPDAVAPRPFAITATRTPASGWSATLPPHSLAVLTFRHER
jgi:alpha-N-arabinofuranosidase